MNKMTLIFIILAAINLGIAMFTLNFAAICGWFSAICCGLTISILES